MFPSEFNCENHCRNFAGIDFEFVFCYDVRKIKTIRTGMIYMYVSSNFDTEWKLSHVPTTDLEVTTAGYAVIDETDGYVFRPDGLADYQLLYIEKGNGLFKIDGTETVIPEKTALIFHPFEPQIYFFSKDIRPKYLWIHIGGPLVESLLKSFDIWDERIFNIRDDSKLIKAILHCITEMTERNRGYAEMAIAYTIQAFSSVARNKTVLPHYEKQTAVEQAIVKIRREYADDTSNSEYAEAANMSLAHFLRLFKEKTGTTPHNYKLQLRVSMAQDMLINTDYKINDIAQSVGFNDPLYFCKYFVKSVGCTPREFRKNNRSR